MSLTEREHAYFGPRTDKPPGSVAWCWQTILLMQSRWKQKTIDEAGFEALVDELQAHEAWNIVPPERPYGSLNALLLAEIGQTVPGTRAPGTACVPPASPPARRPPPRVPPEPAHPLDTATREVTRAYFGDQATFAYAAFDAINAALFAGGLPLPLVTWEITGYGRCLGYTQSGTRPPHIILHPSILSGGSSKPDPWKIPPAWFGPLYALDVLLHESIHVAVQYVRGGRGAGDSSHNCEAWVTEVNRLAPLLGFTDVHCARSKPTRQGKGVTRQTEGNIPLAAYATFPYGVRRLRATASSYYTGGAPCLEVPLPSGWDW